MTDTPRIVDPFYKSKEWYRMRNVILVRDNYSCRMCGAYVRPKGQNCVDHIISRRRRPDLSLDPNNLQTLCHSCHNKQKQIMEANEHKVPVDESGFPASWR